jgi:hypothetical protein
MMVSSDSVHRSEIFTLCCRLQEQYLRYVEIPCEWPLLCGVTVSPREGQLCAGFRTPVMTRLATRWGGRRLKSAKARNRGR